MSWMKLPSGLADASMQLIVDAAIKTVEDKMRATVVQATVTVAWDLADLPYGREPWWEGVREGPISMFTPPYLELMASPVQSITVVNSYDVNNTETEYDASNYRLDNLDPKQQARIVLNLGAIWPTMMRTYGALQVVSVNGYADGQVPAQVRMAMLMVAAWSWTHRVPCSGESCNACGATAALGNLVRVDPAMGRPVRTPQRVSHNYGTFGAP